MSRQILIGPSKVAHFFTGLPVQTGTIDIPQYWYKSPVPVHHPHFEDGKKEKKQRKNETKN